MIEYKLIGLYNFYKSLFELKQIESSDLDWIVCEVLKVKRSEIFTVKNITKKQFFAIKKLIKIRLTGKPLDRVLGKRDFYGRSFEIGKCVLSPRSETELLCEAVIKNCADRCDVLELGTGSGVIAITLKKEKENLSVTATDVSKCALRNAKKNAKKHNADILFVNSFLFEDLSKKLYNIIVSNPPYIPSSDVLGLDADVIKYDPKLALDGGADGLFYYKEIIKNAPNFLEHGGKLFFEIGVNQSASVVKLLEKDFCDIVVIKDFSGIERIVWAKKKEKIC